MPLSAIVYAIDIDHAQMIAAYYKAMGIKAVALDSKTPAKTRQRMVQMIVKINPMYYICVGYRETFSTQIWFWEHPYLTAYFWFFALAQLCVGAYVFHKLRPQFADML